MFKKIIDLIGALYVEKIYFFRYSLSNIILCNYLGFNLAQ